MGLFGGSKSTTSNTTKTNNVAFSEQGSGPAQFVNIDGSNNTVSDYGAIDRALTVAEKSLGSVEQSSQSAVNAANQASSKAIAAVSDAAKKSTQSIIENLMIWVVVGVVGYAAVKKG
jgi:hypothetical protein